MPMPPMPHTRPRTRPPRGELDLRRSAVLLGGAGVCLIALALTVLPWYDDSPGSSIVAGSYRDLRDVETLAELYGLRAPLVLRLYFGWLPAALLLGAIAAAALSAGPRAVRAPARIAAALLGASGVVLTCWALQNLWDRVGGRSGFSILHDSRLGLWCVLAGFALVGCSGGLGLRR